MNNHYCPCCGSHFHAYPRFYKNSGYQQPYQPYAPVNNYPHSNYYTSRQYIITPTELKDLVGKKIRTTIQGIGQVTACVDQYDANANRVTLSNIVHIQTGESYGTQAYLPNELIGYNKIADTCSGAGTEGDSTNGIEDCTVTGGPGKSIASGALPPIPTPVGIFIIKYEVNECQIVAITYFNGVEIGRETLKRGKNSFEWKKDFRTHVVKITGWVVNKEFHLGLEVRMGGRVRFRDNWLIGSWQSLKI